MSVLKMRKPCQHASQGGMHVPCLTRERTSRASISSMVNRTQVFGTGHRTSLSPDKVSCIGWKNTACSTACMEFRACWRCIEVDFHDKNCTVGLEFRVCSRSIELDFHCKNRKIKRDAKATPLATPVVIVVSDEWPPVCKPIVSVRLAGC